MAVRRSDKGISSSMPRGDEHDGKAAKMKWYHWLIGLVLLAMALAVIFPDATAKIGAARRRAECMRRFRSSDPEVRKRAAWFVVEHRDAALEAFMAQQLLGEEPSPDVRESYVYALGKLHDPSVFPAIETVLDAEPNGYVRAAAWLAAARSDADRFRMLLQTRRPAVDAWERLGIAQARVALGDTSGVDELFAAASDDDDGLRYVASRALYKWVRPLLDAVGRWPIDADVGEGQTWPPELVAEAARRCDEFDLQAVAADGRQHEASAWRVRRNQSRITKARNSLARLLFGG